MPRRLYYDPALVPHVRGLATYCYQEQKEGHQDQHDQVKNGLELGRVANALAGL